MATTFKNFSFQATTNPLEAYTAPSGKTAVVTFLNVANNATVNADVTVTLRDISTYVDAPLGRLITIPINTGVNFVADGAKLVLESGDSIVVQASANSALWVVGSVAEMG